MTRDTTKSIPALILLFVRIVAERSCRKARPAITEITAHTAFGVHILTIRREIVHPIAMRKWNRSACGSERAGNGHCFTAVHSVERSVPTVLLPTITP